MNPYHTTRILAVLLALMLGACALPVYPPSAEADKRYGSHCEQLGNRKGSPEYTQCLKRMEDTYR